jgi:hypothetical protein
VPERPERVGPGSTYVRGPRHDKAGSLESVAWSL